MTASAGHRDGLIAQLNEQASHASGRLYVGVHSLLAAAQALLGPTDLPTLDALLRQHGFECWPELSNARGDVLLVRAAAETAEHNVDNTDGLTPEPQARRGDPGTNSGSRETPARHSDVPIVELELSVQTYNTLIRAQLGTLDAIAGRSDDELLAIRNFGFKALHEVRTAIAKWGTRDEFLSDLTSVESEWPTTLPAIHSDPPLMTSDATPSVGDEAQDIGDRFLRCIEGLSGAGRASPLGRVLLRAVATMAPRDLTVLGLRLELTLDEVGYRLDLTRERIRQLEKRGQERLIVAARSAAPGFAEDLSRRMRDGVLSNRELVEIVERPARPALELLVPMLLRALGGRNPRGYRGRIPGFWTLREDFATEAMSFLEAELPLPDGRIPDLLSDARLPLEFPLVDVLRQPGSPAAFHEQACLWVRPNSRQGDAAYLLLHKHATPASADALAEGLGIRPHALREMLRRDSRFRQLRPSGDWALSAWGEYGDQYGTTLDAAVAVLRETGALDYSAFETAVLARYQVSRAAVRHTLGSEHIGRWADGRVDLRERGAPAVVEPEPKRPPNVEVDDQAGIIRFTLTVDDGVVRGSGVPVHPYIAWWLGLREAPSSLTFDLAGAGLVVRRNLGSQSLSSLRQVATDLGARVGCALAVTLDAGQLVAEVRLACTGHSHQSGRT